MASEQEYLMRPGKIADGAQGIPGSFGIEVDEHVVEDHR
jgi:hypothetical protein